MFFGKKYLVFIVCFFYTDAAHNRKEKVEYIKPMKNEPFSFLVDLVKTERNCDIPVKESTTYQKKCDNKVLEKEKTEKQFT